jgi:hypothetical protein
MSTETEVHGNVDMTYNNMHHEHFWLYVAAECICRFHVSQHS